MNISAPAYMQIRQYIISKIYSSDGNLSRIPTERELGKMFNVTRGAVRYALDELVREGYLLRHHGSGTFINPDKAVKPEFRQKTVGLIYGGGQNINFNGSVLDALGNILLGFSEEKINLRFVQLVNNKNPLTEINNYGLDGILWYNPILPHNSQAVISTFEGLRIPLLVVSNHIFPGYKNYVTVDYSTVAHQAAKYFLKKKHRNIAFIAYEEKLPGVVTQFQAFKEIIEKKNGGFDETLCVNNSPDLTDDIKNFLKFRRPSAVYCLSGHGQYALFKAVEELGIKTPDELEIISFEGEAEAVFRKIKFHRIKKPGKAYLRNAVKNICGLINGEISGPVKIVEKPELKIK